MPGPGWRAYDGDGVSVFRPEHRLRDARRQRGLPDWGVPAICRTARGKPVVGFAHVTDTMRQQAGPDSETGEIAGALDTLRLISAAAPFEGLQA